MTESNILNEFENLLLKRKEIKLQISSNSSPSFSEVIDFIGGDKNLIVIKKVSGNFGLNNFIAEVFVYNSKEDKEKIEVIPRKIKKKMQEEAKKAEEKAAEEAKKAMEGKEEIKEGDKNGS